MFLKQYFPLIDFGPVKCLLFVADAFIDVVDGLLSKMLPRTECRGQDVTLDDDSLLLMFSLMLLTALS